MEIGNFVCNFGGNAVLLDHFDEIVEPALLGKHERRYGDTRYLILNAFLVDVGTQNMPCPAVAGRFVKDTVLHQEQRLVDGRLEPAEATLESAPSSLFVLVLRGHRLLYLREHRGSPDMSQFATTVERFMNWTRRSLIDKRYAAAREAGERITKKLLGEALPIPEISVTPVLAEESIEKFLKRFSVLKSIRISLTPTNEEPDYNEFFRVFRRQKESVGASKAQVEYRETTSEGLRVGPASEQLKAAVDGQANFELEGLDQDGRPLKGDNEKFKVKVPIDGDRMSVEEGAASLGSAFRGLVESGSVKEGQSTSRHEATLQSLTARLRQ